MKKDNNGQNWRNLLRHKERISENMLGQFQRTSQVQESGGFLLQQADLSDPNQLDKDSALPFCELNKIKVSGYVARRMSRHTLVCSGEQTSQVTFWEASPKSDEREQPWLLCRAGRVDTLSQQAKRRSKGRALP